MVLIRGKVSSRERDEEEPPIFLDGAELLDGVPASGRLAIQIELEFGEAPGGGSLRRGQARSWPPIPEWPRWKSWCRRGTDSGAPRLRSRTMRADPGPETLESLEKLFGTVPRKAGTHHRWKDRLRREPTWPFSMPNPWDGLLSGFASAPGRGAHPAHHFRIQRVREVSPWAVKPSRWSRKGSSEADAVLKKGTRPSPGSGNHPSSGAVSRSARRAIGWFWGAGVGGAGSTCFCSGARRWEG